MKWNTTENRFVVFFDIMGFKEFVARNNSEVVYNRLKLIKEFLSDYEGIYKNDPEYNDLIKHSIFSDSILIATNGGDEKNADLIINRCNHLIWYCFHNNIPIKGAISFGEMTMDFDNSIFVGQPLIDSYLLQEELEIYGCVLDYYCDKRISVLNNLTENFRKRYYQIGISTKSGKITHSTLKWMSGGIANNIISESDIELVKSFYKTVSGRPRKYVDNTLSYTLEMKKIIEINNT